MRERRKQHKLTKSAEQTNSQQKKRFQLIFRHTTSQCSRAQKPNSKKRKQTNKHAIANTETLSQAWKKNTHLHFKTPWHAHRFLALH